MSLVYGRLLWSLCWNGYLGSYWLWPLLLFTPDLWRAVGGWQIGFDGAAYIYYVLFALPITVFFGRLGRAWQSVRTDPTRLAAFIDTVQRHGAAVCVHLVASCSRSSTVQTRLTPSCFLKKRDRMTPTPSPFHQGACTASSRRRFSSCASPQ
ncbi:hypothetical protein [Streptomyces sp. URMC 124]|uniref:hypothetical protein n=1 Tax=Streptomyces sp. URMC 124 TaxID=3423405 RepID=UPI003F1C2EBA